MDPRETAILVGALAVGVAVVIVVVSFLRLFGFV